MNTRRDSIKHRQIFFAPSSLRLFYNAFESESLKLMSQNESIECKYILPLFKLELNRDEQKILNKIPASRKILIKRSIEQEKTATVVRQIRVFRIAYRIIEEWKNFKYLMKRVALLKPDLIVLGSDQGRWYQLYLITICEKLKIPYVIFSICDIEKKIAHGWGYRFLMRILTKQNTLLNFLKSLTYRGNIIGTFSNDCQIYVIADSMKKKIIERGYVAQDRINVVTPPDLLLSVGYEDKVYHALAISRETTIVTIYTENLIPVFGEEYNNEFIEALGCSIKKILNKKPKLHFVIKFHPHEFTESRNKIQALFSKCENVHLISDQIDTVELIGMSFVNIAHFSRVLLDSLCLNIPIISINLKRCYDSTFIPRESHNELEVYTMEELSERLIYLMDNGSNLNRYCQLNKDLYRSILSNKSARYFSEVILDDFQGLFDE